MTDPVRLAVLGLGRMGSFHVNALTDCDSVEIVDVLDSRFEVAGNVAAALHARAHDTIEGLVDSSDAEAWLIATPTPTHPDFVTAALSRGIHVLCEKPLSLDQEDHESLGAMAAESNLVLQIGFWRRFAAPWAQAKELIGKGAIGEPLMLRLAQWDANPPPPAFCDPAISGGLAIDCGVHEYDLAEWLTGRRVERVAACNLPIVEPAVGASGDVDNLVALLELDGGLAASVDLTRNARYGDDVRTEILGSEGAIFVETIPSGVTRLANHNGVVEVEHSRTEETQRAGVVEQARAFAMRVRGVGAEVPDAGSSARAVAIGGAVQRAAKTGTSEQVPSL